MASADGGSPAQGNDEAVAVPDMAMLAARPLPPSTPHTARILESRRAAMHVGDAPALAFAKSVDSARSPRIAVLSPRRPLPGARPHTLARLPSSARLSSGRGSPRSGRKSPSLDEVKPPAYLKELKLFNGDQHWLFYPSSSRGRAEHVHHHHHHAQSNFMLTSLPDADAAQGMTLDPVAAARVAAAAAYAAEAAGVGADPTLDDDASSIFGSMPASPNPSTGPVRPPSRARSVTFDAAAEPPAAGREPEKRSASFLQRAAEDEVEVHMQRVKWFSPLSPPELRQLMRRAKHRMVPRWSTIIREGAVGSVFYVLLKGSVQVTSTLGLNLVLPAGVSFGEGALVTSVRREATVVALEPCHLVQITAENIEGLSVDLTTLRCHIIGQMLAKIRFFSQLDIVRRHALAALLDIEYMPSMSCVFEEGDPGDKFYMVNEGRVAIYQGSLEYERGEDGEHRFPIFKRDDGAERGALLLGEFTHDHPYPWFGEMALVSTASRSASAMALEPTKVLSLDRSRFAAFISIIPTFTQIFATSTKSYTAINDLQQQINRGKSQNRARLKALEAAEDAEDARGGALDQKSTHNTLASLAFGRSGAPAGALDLLFGTKSPEPADDEPAMLAPLPPMPPMEDKGPLKGRGAPQLQVEVLENEFERAARSSMPPGMRSPRSESPVLSSSRHESPMAHRSSTR